MDPWPGRLASPLTRQAYLYARGNPLVYRDPSGRWVPDDADYDRNAMPRNPELYAFLFEWYKGLTSQGGGLQGSGITFGQFQRASIAGVDYADAVTALDLGRNYNFHLGLRMGQALGLNEGEAVVFSSLGACPALESELYQRALCHQLARDAARLTAFYAGLRLMPREGRPEPPGLASNREGHGHHIYGKALFRNHPNYDEDDALYISQDYMTQRGCQHESMTGTQNRLYAELYRSGGHLIMEEATRIAVAAMVEGNVPPDQAQAYAAAALAELRAMGVTAPTYFARYGPLEGATP